MPTLPSVIQELRSMFKEGATPSRLMQHIVACHPAEESWHGVIQDYFREAFGVPIVRGLDPEDNFQNVDLRYAFLNEDLLHEMIQLRKVWDQDLNGSQGSETPWLDRLAATATEKRLQDTQRNGFPELAACWEKLNEKDRFVISRMVAGFNGRTEMVRILARLAERLQQRVVELGQQHSEFPGKNIAGEK